MRGKLITFSAAAAGALALLIAAFGGTAVAKDRNHDQIPDKWEKKFHLSLSVNQANKDQDKDGVDNLNEFQEGTSPRSKDTNHNGVPDGKEDSDHDGLSNHMEDVTANLPNDQDTDNDGIQDGAENAGVIATFDGTTLTINLAGGGQATGTVTTATEIKCENEQQQEAEDTEDNSGSGTATASQDGGSQSGDDVIGGDSGLSGSDEQTCTTSDLTPGTAVHEAQLENGSFTEIDLVK
jgi:hypothetical protein